MRPWGAYEGILRRYTEYKAAAARYDSPNPEDEDFAKLAMAGYSGDRLTRALGHGSTSSQSETYVPEACRGSGVGLA